MGMKIKQYMQCRQFLVLRIAKVGFDCLDSITFPWAASPKMIFYNSCHTDFKSKSIKIHGIFYSYYIFLYSFAY